MKNKKVVNTNIFLMLALSTILVATIISGCSGSPGNIEGSGGEAGESGHSEMVGEGGGEHGSESGLGAGEISEAGHTESGGETGSGVNALALNETYDVVRSGARLILAYDVQSNAFIGTMENTTSSTLTQVRVEIHLSNGTELGPTPRTDLAPGEIMNITLPATSQTFDSWSSHAEVGSGDGDGESGTGSAESGEVGAGGHAEGGESGDPSSPILALNESWDGVVNGIRVAMSFNPVTQSFSGIVENTTAQTICSVQIELNLKQGTTTVVELGPAPIGDLALGEQGFSQLFVADEPAASGLAFDAWEIHPEMFDCNGPGPIPHSGGEGAEGSGGEGSEGGHNEGGGG